jgi:hypothetical protein
VIAAPSDHSNDGTHTITYYSTDHATNQESDKTATVKIDTTKPLSSASAGSATVTNASPFTINYAASDPGSDKSGLDTVELWVKLPGGSSYSLAQTDSSPGATGSFSYTPGAGQGTYSFYTRAADKAGNVEVPPGAPDAQVTVLLDTTAPVTTDDADSSWHNAAVTVHLSATDGPVSSPSGVDKTFYKVDAGSFGEYSGSIVIAAPSDHSNDGTHTITYYSTDHATNQESDKTATVKIDTTKPSITNLGPTPSSPNGTNNWYVTAVSNGFKASDPLSGLSAACVTAFPINGAGDQVKNVSTGTQEGSTVKVSSGTCADLAGNIAASLDSANFKIDLTDPTVTCPSPTPTFLASKLPLDLVANVSDATSGPLSPTAAGSATNANGGTVSITGYDQAGRSKTVSCGYHVGNTTFYAPVDKSPIMNIAKLGRVVPVKLNFSYDGNPITATGIVYVGAVSNISCTEESTATDTIDVYAAGASNTGNLFRWDASGPQWIYNFDTSAFSMAAGNCYRISVYYGGTVTNGTGSGGNRVGYFLMKTTK